MKRAPHIVALAAIVVASQFGCSSGEMPAPAPIDSQPTNKRFTSAEEGLNAAKSLYLHYLKSAQAVAEDGGEGVSRLEPLLTARAFAEEREGVERVRERGLKSIGETKLIVFRRQRVDARTGQVTAYACVDLSDVRVLDSRGEDVTPESRPNRQTSVPRFVWSAGHLALDGDGQWSGDSIC